MPTPIIECPRCQGKRSKFKSLGVNNVDQIFELRSCLLCGVDFNYVELPDGYITSYNVAQEEKKLENMANTPTKEEGIVFSQCKRCGKFDVLPSEWVELCPNCIFRENLPS